jgi:hypothetical protein
MTSEKRYYTYAYLREDGTPYYVGKGKGRRAFQRHCIAVPPKERILFLKRNLTEKEAVRHEIYMIAVLGRKDKGLGILWNFTDGGEGTSGRVQSEETRRKIAEAARNRKPPSEESKRKNRESNLGKKRSEETRKKISESNRRRKSMSAEGRQRVSEANTGRKHSKEARQKMSEAASGRKWFVNESGETCKAHESPGPCWREGRK